jgi:RalA-binding protein 1
MLLSPPDFGTSRDSRVSLPDEARRYISNMTDSPIPSNYADSPVEKSSFTHSMESSIQLSTLAPSTQSREIEMDDEEDEEVTDSSEPRDISLPSDTPISVDTHSEESSRHMGGNGGAHAAVDDFPLPPSNTHLYPQRIAATHNVAASQSHTSQPTKHYDVINPSVARSQSGSIQPQSQASDGESTFSIQAKISPFRALPLLSSDLPTTTIIVSHSFIRPNDRGKEVLSFIVFVNPGNGKPGWKVEKMYSDVLSLDQRVRQSVGKGVGKKIASLPEGKLWKDHAPARVDQRKAGIPGQLFREDLTESQGRPGALFANAYQSPCQRQ